MAELHRIDRRLFLTDLGRRTFAVAVLGSGVLAACSSDGEIAVSDDSVEPSASTTTSSATSTAAPTTTPAPAKGSSEDPDLPTLRWERVSLGFVSAYVLARGDKVSIIDTGTAGSATQIEAALTTLGAGWDSVNSVVLTHLHPDHIGGLPSVLDMATKATVHAGRADAEAIDADRAVEALDDGDEIFGLQVIATPGHTPGHIAIFDPAAGFLVAGDALNESDGMVLGPNPDFTQDLDVAHASVQRLAERTYETVVFGHGEPIETGASDAVVALAQTLG